MAKLLVDIVVSLPEDRIFRFKKLAEELSKTVPETMELCMFEKCDEYLDMFENNKPNKED